MKKTLSALAVSLLMAFVTIQAAQVENLRCEFRVNPLSIDATKPGLSWKLEMGNRKPERGIRQTAYQILVASTPEILRPQRPHRLPGKTARLWRGLPLESEGVDD
jgi:alpha-L-rhamnosidase